MSIKYSVSRLDLFDRCPFAYKRRYIDKVKRAAGSTALTFGSQTHACLENCYRCVVEDEIQGELPDDIIVDCCKKAAVSADTSGLSAAAETTQLTRLYFRDREVDCHSVLGIEKRFEMTINGVPLLGYIDLVKRVGDDAIVVTDFKTNKRPFDEDELNNSLQAGIYWYASRKMWPWANNVKFVFDMLRSGVEQSPDNIKELARRCFEYLPVVVEKIEKATETGKFPPSLHMFCAWCDYAATCPEYLNVMEKPFDSSAAEAAAHKGDISALARIRDDLAAKQMGAKEQLKKVDRILKAKITEKNGPLIANGSKYNLITLPPRAFSAADVLKQLKRAHQEVPGYDTMVNEFCDLSEASLKNLFGMYKVDRAARAMVMVMVKASANRKSRPMTLISSSSAKLDK